MKERTAQGGICLASEAVSGEEMTTAVFATPERRAQTYASRILKSLVGCLEKDSLLVRTSSLVVSSKNYIVAVLVTAKVRLTQVDDHRSTREYGCCQDLRLEAKAA